MLEQAEPHSHSPVPRLPVPKQNRWGPSPGKGTSVCLFPGKRATGKVQCGNLHSGKGLIFLKNILLQTEIINVHLSNCCDSAI